LKTGAARAMALTIVSNAWREDGSAVPARRARNGTASPPLWAASSGHDKGAEDPKAFGVGGRRTTCGLRQRRPSSKPFAALAIAPGPCRGWGRKPLACIHTQREPVVPPAGTGTEYRRPEGSPGRSPQSMQAVRRPLAIDARNWISGMARCAIRGGMAFSSRGPRWTGGTRTPLQKGSRAGEPAGGGMLAPPSRRGRGIRVSGRLGRTARLARRTAFAGR
jgi:hypothetical protein